MAPSQVHESGDRLGNWSGDEGKAIAIRWKNGVWTLHQAEDGRTPLHSASSSGHVDVARMLMERSADMSAQAEDGRTPLHWALENNYVDVAQMLVEHSANGQPIQFDSHS